MIRRLNNQETLHKLEKKGFVYGFVVRKDVRVRLWMGSTGNVEISSIISQFLYLLSGSIFNGLKTLDLVFFLQFLLSETKLINP